MFYLQRLTQANPLPGLPQPIPELDIFNGRPTILLTKSPYCQEHLAPDGAAGAPEGARVFAGRLVDVMVEKIFVLREEIRRRRFVVIGAEDGCVVRFSGKSGHHLAQSIRGKSDISIDEEKDIATSCARSQIARPSRSSWARDSQDLHAEFLSQQPGPVCIAISYHNNFLRGRHDRHETR